MEDNEETEFSGRVAGTVRRHMAIDTRDPPGAILHFYVGDSFDPNRLFHFLKLPVLFLLVLRLSNKFLLGLWISSYPARLIMIIF